MYVCNFCPKLLGLVARAGQRNAGKLPQVCLPCEADIIISISKLSQTQQTEHKKLK